MRTRSRLRPSRATRPVVLATAVCSLAFAIGSALQNFWIVDTPLVETMMRHAGAAHDAGAAADFVRGFRVVGCLYIVGNAVGVLVLVARSWLLWWWVLVVNSTQSLGWVMIPTQMWSAARDRHGVLGLLPSAVTDGGALLLVLVLLSAWVWCRGPWAQRRETEQTSSPRVPA
ncbi:hypothetical protein [Actinocatenispora comari]|jgi:hypothetical protein|uniref:Uncharacterized protein n=1 Tax=Actinocatenispora comari TaxID=2807577 RepID=A0A8J4A7X6_9ACTN|nr:hypothetical protein [Actinocatenispora comari]GIL25339.1 hypothetical protein NUM_05940 [Actinocatenispora comari]